MQFLARLTTLLLAVSACLGAGLFAESWVPVSIVDPTQAHSSGSVPARGYPHPWLVSESTTSELAPGSKRLLRGNLAMSFLFWLAVWTPLLACVRAVFRRLRAARTGLQYPPALWVLGGLATAACGATYAWLFAGPRFLFLLTGTSLVVLPPLQVYAARRMGATPSRIGVGSVIAGVLLSAASFEDLAIPSLPFVVVFLILTAVVGLGFVYWLATPPPETERVYRAPSHPR